MRSLIFRVLLLVAALVGCLALGPTLAQHTAELPLAAITNDNVWLYSLTGASRPLTNARPGERFHDVT